MAKRAKKRTKKRTKTNKNALKDAPEGKRFWLCDGRIIKNMKELEKALRNMSKNTYKYHANDNKNDFSNWIKDVFNEKTLAKNIKKSRNKKTAANKIKRKYNL